MDKIYYSVNIDNERTLCIAPLTDRRITMSGQEIDDTSGYFLFEKRGYGAFAGIEIIARLASEDAVDRLRDMLNMS